MAAKPPTQPINTAVEPVPIAVQVSGVGAIPAVSVYPQSSPDGTSDSILVNTIAKLTTSNSYVYFMILTLILTVVLFIVLIAKDAAVDGAPSTTVSNAQALWLSTIILFILAIVAMISLLYVPSLKSILGLLDKMGNVFVLFIFIVGLVIFYNKMAPDAVEHYKYVIVPVIILLAFVLFGRAMKQSSEESYNALPNLPLEKIRFSLVYFAFIVFTCLMYFIDFGGFLKNALGPSVTATMILMIVGFIYLLNLLSFPITNKSISAKTVLPSFSWFTFGHTMLLVATFLGVASAIVFDRQSYVDDDDMLSFKNSKFATVVGISVTLLILWTVFFLIRLTTNPVDTLARQDQSKLTWLKYIGQRAFIVMGGIAGLVLIIYWISKISNDFAASHDTGALLINIGVIFVLLIFLYRFISNTTHFNKSPYVKLGVNILFYLPCLLYDIIHRIFSMVGIQLPSLNDFVAGIGSGASALKDGVSSQTIGTGSDVKALLVVLAIYAAYFIVIPYTINKAAKQGGNVIQLDPISITVPKTLGTYLELNGIETPDNNAPLIDSNGVRNYNYAISFWIYMKTSSTTGVDEYYTVLNYGDIPHIMWNPHSSTMIFTLKNTDSTTANDLKYPEEMGPNGNITAYTLKDMKLQQWNNVVVNFTNGTFDIFINSKLVKSKIQVVPKVTYDVLEVGSSALNGKICNVIYFNYSITMTNIHYLYNLVKQNDPPISNSSKLGQSENPVIVKIKDVTKTIIPIDIKMDVIDNSISFKEIEKKVDSVNPYKVDKNYLSLSWYFNQNKDPNNSISTGETYNGKELQEPVAKSIFPPGK